ncbi:unnamed protein product [Diplocarpon coronariae]
MTWNPFLCTRGDPVQGHQRSNMGMSPDAVEVEGTTDEPTLDGAWNGSSTGASEYGLQRGFRVRVRVRESAPAVSSGASRASGGGGGGRGEEVVGSSPGVDGGVEEGLGWVVVGAIDGKSVGVMITREPGNPYDSNAIRINNVHGTRTGHLPLESGEQAGAVFGMSFCLCGGHWHVLMATGCENHRAPRHHPPERADVLPRPDQSSPFLPSKDKSGVDSAGLSAATAVEVSRLHPARPAAAGTSRPADPIS